ncbi:GGDEF domain-containing protein [Vibrio coralliilyticus]|uniref:GGDEF domain-containing protein n=1 Tax=Vibrio coralliilyticus TaxID=190893 RepID=UPI002FD37FF1
MNENNQVITDKDKLIALVNELPAGSAVGDKSGNIIHFNEEWASLPESLQNFTKKKIKEQKVGDFNLVVRCCSVTIIQFFSYFVAITNNEDERLAIKDKLLMALLPLISKKESISESIVEQIGLLLNWKRVGVTQLKNNDQVNVISMWENNVLLPSSSYSLKNEPCHKVFSSKKFTRANRKNNQDFSSSIIMEGQLVYAGYPYYDSAGNITGHIFLVNDNPCVDWQLTEDILHIVSSFLSANIQLIETDMEADKQKELARTDSLTSLNNRMAFDTDIAYHIKKASLVAEEFVLAIIDLDGMKTINDSLGHDKGDRFLQEFSSQLVHVGRAKDRFYRIGGDEFACLFLDTDLSIEASVRKRIKHIIDSIRELEFKDAGASCGFASSGEFSSLDKLIKSADERMYEDKSKNKNSY